MSKESRKGVGARRTDRRAKFHLLLQHRCCILLQIGVRKGDSRIQAAVECFYMRMLGSKSQSITQEMFLVVDVAQRWFYVNPHKITRSTSDFGEGLPLNI